MKRPSLLLASFLLISTTQACIQYYVAITWEIVAGWGAVVNIADNGVLICGNGGTTDLGNYNWQGSCIAGFSVFLYGVNHEDTTMQLNTPVNTWSLDLFDSCGFSSETGEYDAFCSGDDGTC